MADEILVKKKVVFIGGGGGAVNIGPALRDHYDVTLIVSVFDNGGSYGRLRGPYRSPLTGDVRQALAALSTNEWGALAQHRFERSDVKGHALGNLVLTAAHTLYDDPGQAMDIMHRLYAVRGRVLPVSYTFADLTAELMDRTMLRGETVIDEPHAKSHVRIRRLWLDPDATMGPGVAEAIAQADLILMGPGDLYTSLVPNLLVDGVAQAVINSPAKKAYFCNVSTKYGQTNEYSAFEHVRALESYLQPLSFKHVVINTSELPDELIRELKRKNEKPVAADIETLTKAGYAVLNRDLLDGKFYEQPGADAVRRSRIRYAPEKVREVVEAILCA